MTATVDPYLVDHLLSLGRWTNIAAQLLTDRTEEDFRTDLMFELAVSKAVEMVGEVPGRILKRWPESASQDPGLQLSNAYALRNRLAHGYESVDLVTVWRTVWLSVPEMDMRVRAILEDLGDHDP